MRITSLELKNFRCFPSLKLDFDKDIVFIFGSNGTGKTSILEALYYCCYLRSFKTYTPKELIHYDANASKILLTLSNSHSVDTLKIGFDFFKRTVKLNQKVISTFKDVYATFKVVTLTADDIKIIQDGPIYRRSFLDTTITLSDSSYLHTLKKYRQILENRNALLNHHKKDSESYLLWTQQLLDISLVIQKKRIEISKTIENELIFLLNKIPSIDYSISIEYQCAKPYLISEIYTVEELAKKYPALQCQEFKYKRSLFGAHLDDLKISIQNRSSRIYASRGQQKFITFLLKLAQLKYLNSTFNKQNSEKNIVFLLDDFVTDFDTEKILSLFELSYQLSSQIILTSPLNQNPIQKLTNSSNIQVVNLKEPKKPDFYSY